MEQKAFQISILDNIATVLTDIIPGQVDILGDSSITSIQAITTIPKGHKIALCNINDGNDIFKYGVRIGRATKTITTGEWVHLHNIHSIYDKRSSHLDIKTGAPTDIIYQ